jgi:RNA polymerase sigma-70 factor (ECF subfamily)
MLPNSDNYLVDNYLKGDEKSLEIIIRRYLKPIYSFAYKYVGNSQDAEEITQDTFIKMWRHLRRFDKHRSFKTWIFTIAKNTAIDFLKKKKTIPLSELSEIVKDEKTIEYKDITDEFAMIIKKLSPKYQEVLSLYYSDHFTFREIAETLGEPLNTIKSRHRRALILLRRFPR